MEILTTLRLLAPEFSSVPDDDVAQWIDLCEPMVSKARFGSLYKQAVALLAAHRMKLSGKYDAPDTSGILNLAASGKVASYTEGQTSISFHAPASSSGGSKEYDSSEYGRQYLDLRRSTIVPILID